MRKNTQRKTEQVGGENGKSKQKTRKDIPETIHGRPHEKNKTRKCVARGRGVKGQAKAAAAVVVREAAIA